VNIAMPARDSHSGKESVEHNMTDLEKEIENAIQVCNNLSRDARAAGDMPTMYAANRAWHQLSDARSDLNKRRTVEKETDNEASQHTGNNRARKTIRS
jgi:hypothetical protein